MNFLEAMAAVKDGEKVARSTWAGNNANISHGDRDFLWSSKDHPEQHYHPTYGDIFAEDWEIV